MKFVIFHGAFGYADSNWFPYLKTKLESIGQKVIVPQFPVDDWQDITDSGVHVFPKYQKLSNWSAKFEEEVLPEIKNSDDVCFIGHSVACVFILHLVTKFNLKLDSAIFVAPFLTKLNGAWQIDHVNNSFYKDSFEWNELKKQIPVSYSIYSDNDPYVDNHFSLRFADNIGASKIIVKNAGHFNDESGFDNFPLVFDLCTTRMDLSKINYLK